MKAYKLEVLVIDHENLGKYGIITEIENRKFSYPIVKKTTEVDIGEWSDDHPLNKKGTCDEEYQRIFDQKNIPLLSCCGQTPFLSHGGNRYYPWSLSFQCEICNATPSPCYCISISKISTTELAKTAWNEMIAKRNQ